MRLHLYIVEHDLGFAPNPFHRTCTLAACKPRIRKHAAEGDYVAGVGSVSNNLRNHIIYWMHIDEIIKFDDYWSDIRFLAKRPVMAGSRMQRYGDNIYHRDENGNFKQADSFHSEPGGLTSWENLGVDTGYTDKVLVGREYAYWGRSAPRVPDEFSDLLPVTQGHRNKFPELRRDAFVGWLRAMPDRGYIGRPADWP